MPFIESNLFLKVNREKTVIDYVGKVKFLGFTFGEDKGKAKVRIHKKSKAKMKGKLKELTKRSNGWSNDFRARKLREYIMGWIDCFKIAEIKTLLKEVDQWLRRRIRMVIWKQWKRVRTKFAMLQYYGLDKQKAWEFANTRKGYWRISNSPILSQTLGNEEPKSLDFITFSDYYKKVTRKLDRL